MNRSVQRRKAENIFWSFGQRKKHYLNKDYKAKEREIAEQDVAKISTILADQAIARLQASKH